MRVLWLFLLSLSRLTPSASAQIFDFGSQIAALAAQQQSKLQAVTPTLLQNFGLGQDHRAYSPASSLGTALGLEIMVEATLFKTTSDFASSLATAGLNIGSNPPSLPALKLHLAKGLSNRVDFGISTIFYQGYFTGGGHLKFVVWEPEEGLTWALRVGYNVLNIQYVVATTYSVQVLASRKLDFAEPYIGFGYHYAVGGVHVTLSPQSAVAQGIVLPAQYAAGLDLTTSSAAGSLQSFIGLAMFLGPTGLKLTMEGAYDSIGMHYIGMKFGLGL